MGAPAPVQVADGHRRLAPAVEPLLPAQHHFVRPGLKGDVQPALGCQALVDDDAGRPLDVHDLDLKRTHNPG